MIRAGRGHARGDHVAVADGLDLLDAVALGENVEVAEQVVEHADDFGRRKAPRERSEVHDVREQDRRRAELVRDRLRLGLEPVGDGPGQDVEQQALRSRLLLSQRRECVPALGGEEGQEREHDRAAHRDVEGQHRAREPFGDGRRHAAEQRPGDPRPEEHDEPRDEPASGGSDVAEHERPERGEDSPQTDSAGVQEAPERDHGQRGSQQDRDLTDTEELTEVPAAREDDER